MFNIARLAEVYQAYEEQEAYLKTHALAACQKAIEAELHTGLWIPALRGHSGDTAKPLSEGLRYEIYSIQQSKYKLYSHTLLGLKASSFIKLAFQTCDSFIPLGWAYHPEGLDDYIKSLEEHLDVRN